MNRIDLAAEAGFAIGGLGVRPALRSLTLDGAEKTLEPRVMQVLVALARRPGEVVSRDEFVETCWAGRHVGEDAIQRTIAKLRAVGEWSGAFAVETIARVGYRLNITAAAPTTTADAPPLLAVLAFDNLSPDEDLGFFAHGLSDEILHTLARATRIRVIGRASSFQLRDAAKASAHVRTLLGATHLLDGSVRRSGKRLRIGVQLIETATGVMLWSEEFDRMQEDALTLQLQIAGAVAKVLHAKFSPEVRGSVEPVLHERIVRAFRTALDGPVDPAQISAIDELVRQAPGNALGWAFAAEARNYARMRPELGDELAQRFYDEQRRCAERAMSLDPTLAPALLAYGGLQPPCGAFSEREKIFRAADGYGWLMPPLTYLLLSTGRSSEALANAQVGREREPLIGPVRTAHQLALAQLGKLAEWEALVENDARRHPPAPHEWATIVQLAALFGHWDMVRRWTGPEVLPAHAGAVSKRHARTALETVENCRDPTRQRRDIAFQALRAELDLRGYVPLFDLTAACVFGDLAGLWDLVARSRFEPLLQPGGRLAGAPGNSSALFLPHAASLRQDPKFMQLCARLGLTRHWLETDRWPDCAGEVPYDFRAEALIACSGSVAGTKRPA